jgi:TrmH family RNA methyltransferase
MISKNRIKYLTSLKQKKFCAKYKQFLVEGDKIVKELLSQSHYLILEIYCTEKWLDDNRSLVDQTVQVYSTDISQLKQISSLVTTAEVMALVAMKEKVTLDLENGRFIYLDRIQDPGNFGTIWRTADWFGIDGILCNHGTVDAFNPKVLQSSMGAFLRVDVFHNIDLQNSEFNSMNLFVADMNGKDIKEVEWSDNFILVLGNESSGVSQEIRGHSNIHLVSISRSSGGGAESLNVASACAIIIYEALKNKKS